MAFPALACDPRHHWQETVSFVRKELHPRAVERIVHEALSAASTQGSPVGTSSVVALLQVEDSYGHRGILHTPKDRPRAAFPAESAALKQLVAGAVSAVLSTREAKAVPTETLASTLAMVHMEAGPHLTPTARQHLVKAHGLTHFLRLIFTDYSESVRLATDQTPANAGLFQQVATSTARARVMVEDANGEILHIQEAIVSLQDTVVYFGRDRSPDAIDRLVEVHMDRSAGDPLEYRDPSAGSGDHLQARPLVSPRSP